MQEAGKLSVQEDGGETSDTSPCGAGTPRKAVQSLGTEFDEAVATASREGQPSRFLPRLKPGATTGAIW